MRRLLSLIAVLLIASLWTPFASAQEATPAGDCAPPTAAGNTEIAERYIDAFNTGDLDALDALLAPDYAQRAALGPDQDRELHKDRIQINRTAFPDAVWTIDDIIVEGDYVVIRHTMRGTNLGEYAGQPPTGIAVEVSGIHVNRIECGLIAEAWNEGDGLGLYRQLGLLPSPDETAIATPAVPAEASPTSTCEAGLPEANAAVARDYLDIWNTKDLDRFDELASPSVVHHWAQGADTTGVDALRASTEAFFAAFPDLAMSFDQVIVEGDEVVIRWTLTGTQTGQFFELEPSGTAATWTGINIYRIDCGQVAESWSETDAIGLRRQLGDPNIATPVS